MLVSMLLAVALQAPAVVGVTAPEAGPDWFGIEATVTGGPGVVVAYVSVPGEAAARVVPLGEKDPGTWEGIVPVAPLRAIGIEIEALYGNGTAVTSGPHALGLLGLPDAAFGTTTAAPPGEGPPARNTTPLWIGSLAAVGAVALVGIARLVGRRTEEP